VAEQLLTYGDQPEQSEEGVGNNLLPSAALVGGIVGGYHLGFGKSGNGRLWDKFGSVVRAVESVSPGGILKTFRISELASVLETQQEELLGPHIKSGKYAELLKKTVGGDLPEGLKFVPSKGGIFGELVDDSGKAIATGLRIRAGSQEGAAIADYYARVSGVKLGPYESINDSILRNLWQETDLKVPFDVWKKSLDQKELYKNIILAAPLEGTTARAAQAKVLTNLARAHSAAQIGRLSNLLRKPLDIVEDVPIAGDLVKRLPGVGSMAAAPGTTTQMLGRFVGKAVAVGAAWKALEYADYLRSEGDLMAAPITMGVGAAIGGRLFAKPGAPFSRGGLLGGLAVGAIMSVAPRFSEGLFYGAASLGSDADTLRAKVSDITGYTESIKQQNEITKNLITTSTALGFAGVGALTAGLGSYGVFLRDVWKQRGEGPISEVADKIRYNSGALIEEFWQSSKGMKLAEKPLLGRISKIRSPLALGAIAGLAVWQAASTALSLLSGNIRTAIPGLPLLMSGESEEEKRAIYSGEKEVAVRKGRFWEFGRSPYEGENEEYYRQHFIPRLRSRAYQKGLYGTEEEKFAYDPMLHPIKAMFGTDEWKYYYERKYAYDRPAPVSGGMFEDVPFIGPLLSATLGEVFKPRKLIRPEEWSRGGGEYLYRPDVRGETEPAYGLGGVLPGAPVMPNDTTQLFNELNYRRTEMIGLPGFMEESIRKAITGRNEPFQNLQTLASMGSEASTRSWFWEHLNIGGAAGLSEGIRRFIPSKRSYLQEYNPLKNQLASWMPDEYFLDLKYGNPWEKIKEAEIRLPGAGFCLHPDTKICTKDNWFLPIKEIVIGEEVLTSKGYKKVVNTFSRYFNGDLVSINTYGSLVEETQLTPEHLVKAVRIKKCKYHKHADKKRRPCKKLNFCEKNKCKDYLSNQIEWTRADALEEGDYVLLPLLKEEDKNFTIDVPETICDKYNLEYIGDNTYQTFREWKRGTNKIIPFKKISCQIHDSKETWFVFGLYIAEGSLGNNKVNFSLNIKENFISDFISSVFGGTFYKKKINENNNFQDNEKSAYHCVYNLVFSKYIKETFGSSENKKLPKNLSKEQFLSLLSGWCQGDSTRPKEGINLTISEKYQTLLKDLLYYLNIYNIDHSIKDRNPNDRGYEIRIYASSINQFRFIGDKDKRISASKTISNFTIDGHRAFKIKKIEKVKYKGLVYDIEVEDAHEYVTSFLVHNSALYPDVEGLSPEEYPIAYQVKILGDVAMYSAEYEAKLREAKSVLKQLPPNQARIILETEKQVREKKRRKEFSEYGYLTNQLNQESVTVTEIVSPRLFKTKEYGSANIEIQGIGPVRDSEAAMSAMRDALVGKSITIHTPIDDIHKFDSVSAGPRVKALVMANGVNLAEWMDKEGYVESEPLEKEFSQFNYSLNERLAGALSDTMLHNIETPLEYLTPFSPASKFIHQRSAIEDYVATQAVGTKNAFWDKPYENFFQPAKDMFLYKSGLDSDVPKHIQDRRKTNEYFDMLKWVKASRAEEQARMLGDARTAALMAAEKSKTVFGMDVFGNPTSIMRALPRNERDYFNAFTEARTPEERDQILSLVPENLKRLYTSQWMSKAAAAAYAKKEAGIATAEDLQAINTVRQLRASEGLNYAETDIQLWQRETQGQVPFDEWLRNRKAAAYFSTHSLPDPSWIGWNPAVDIDDIKMKYVENSGSDYHDHDLWDQRKIALARKPYVDVAYQGLGANAPYQDAYTAKHQLRKLANTYGSKNHRITQYQTNANVGGNRYNITVDDRRESLVQGAYKQLGA
jgi:intein/homing endonuclease